MVRVDGCAGLTGARPHRFQLLFVALSMRRQQEPGNAGYRSSQLQKAIGHGNGYQANRSGDQLPSRQRLMNR